jgi:hypothetical protein
MHSVMSILDHQNVFLAAIFVNVFRFPIYFQNVIFWPQILSFSCHTPIRIFFNSMLRLKLLRNFLLRYVRTTGSKYKKYFSLLLDGNGNQNWVFVTEIETKESSRFFLKMMIKSFHFMIAQRDIFMTVISYCCCSKICCCFSWW